MRLLGIPARIATGYLVDTNFAKDGHILLQLGDRHAWPEVYVEGQGWMVFDVSPAQAENEPTLVPNESLLLELMSKLSPPEALLEPVPANPADFPSTERFFLQAVNSRNILATLLTALFLFLLTKTWLRWGYLITSGKRQTHMAYVSFASFMADLGHYREDGETRKEYAARLKQNLGVDAGEITLLNEQTKYAKATPSFPRAKISSALGAVACSFDRTNKKIKRILAFFSPLSIRRLSSW